MPEPSYQTRGSSTAGAVHIAARHGPDVELGDHPVADVVEPVLRPRAGMLDRQQPAARIVADQLGPGDAHPVLRRVLIAVDADRGHVAARVVWSTMVSRRR